MVAVRKGKLTFRNVYTDDVENALLAHIMFKTNIQHLYALLLERPKEANISHSKMPTLKEHTVFVCQHPYDLWYLICVGPIVVGAIYLTYNQEIGIAIYEQFQGNGYAKKAIRVFMGLNKELTYKANIAPGNKKSQTLFERLGFKPIQITYKSIRSGASSRAAAKTSSRCR